MKTERDLFEEWFCNNHTGLNPNDLIKFRQSDGYSFSNPIKVNLMWEAWQASSQRGVYKLLPEYHKENIRDALIIACDTKEDEQRFEDSLNYVHKATIGDNK